MDEKPWSVYIVRCRDGKLYTGITTDIDRRIARHNEGKAAKYTRARRPVKLVYNEAHHGESSARKREYAIKKLSREQKLKLVRSGKKLV